VHDDTCRRLCVCVRLTLHGGTRRHGCGGGLGTPSRSLAIPPSNEVLALLNNLTSDSANSVCIVSGRSRTELGEYLKSTPNVGIAAEHGCARVLVPCSLGCLSCMLGLDVLDAPSLERSDQRAFRRPAGGPGVA
jgi:hypothetical protein